ncbi:alkaline phosphatase, partial [Streptomyces hydrogenans]
RICGLEAVDTVVTDAAAPADAVARLQDAGIEVIRA